MQSAHCTVFVATIAAGGGDLAFAAAAISALALAPGSPPTAYALVAQAGRDAAALAPALAQALARRGAAAACLGCFARGRDNAVTRVESSGDSSSSASMLPVRSIVQGPLHLFDSPAEALAALGLPLPLPAAPLPRLLTVREFGMQRFLPRSSSSSGSAEQVSAGLGEGEWGVFGALALPPPVVQAAGPSATCLGYFRTPEHGERLGLLLGTALALQPQPRLRPRQHLPVRVLAPAAALGAVEAGLRRHPALLLRVEEEAAREEAGASAPPAGRRLLLEWGGASGGSALVALEALELSAQPVPQPEFQALLAGSLCAMVTGDASANEALAAGVPFVYSCEGHKGEFEAQLWAEARRGAEEGAGAVARVWEFCSAAGGLARQWGAAEAALAGGGLARAFAAWSQRLLQEKGVLEHRLRAWAVA